MKTQKILTLLLVIIILFLVVVGISFGNRGSTNITIGVLVPLTGTSASIGERIKNSIEVALPELQKKSPFPLKVVYEDDKGAAPQAVIAAKKLIDTDHIHLIIGTVKSDAMLAVAPITEKARVILLSPTAGADAISQAGDYVFRDIELPSVHGEAAASYVMKQTSKAALFTAKASNAQSYGKYFKQNFEQKGGTITLSTDYDQTAPDFRTEIVKAKQSGAQAFYLAVATAKDAGILVRQSRELGFKGMIMASVATDAKEFFDTAGDAAEGTVITASHFDPNTSEGAVYNNAYRAKYGTNGDGFGANSYDAITLLSNAVTSCKGDTDTTCIRDFLYSTKNFPGASGTFSFDSNGDVSKPVNIKVAHNNTFVVTE